MNLLSVHEISRQFDSEPVFQNVSFEVYSNDKIGLIGPNGCGKTTLLSCLANKDYPDKGDIELANTAEIALLEQETDFAPNETVLDVAKSGLEHLYQLQDRSQNLAEKMAEEKDANQLEKLHKQFDAIQQELHYKNAFQIDHLVEEVLHGLGFLTSELDKEANLLSGGQQHRLLLAKMLLRSPSIMLLDEPTNHLDINATQWLEDYLSKSQVTIILVSHDRFFLDRVTNRIFELFNSRLAAFKGNYSSYKKQREERNKVLEKTYEKQQDLIARTEEFIRKNKYGQNHAQASDREKKLARIEQVELPHNYETYSMSFGKPDRTGDWVLDVANVSNGFDTLLFENFSTQILRGQRIGIVGPNGCGKTTLLRTLMEEIPAQSGLIRWGTGVKLAYFDQKLSGVDPELEVVEAIRPPNDLSITAARLRSLLARFGIKGDMAFQKVSMLSGGEKSKVALARLSALNANVLFMDEPTNHLDLWARDALEKTMKEFEGTILFVSHDRYFLDQLATNVILLTPERWYNYEGNYSDFLLFQKNQLSENSSGNQTDSSKEEITRPKNSEEKKNQKRKRKYPYRKVEEIENDIASEEEKLAQLEADLSSPEVLRDGIRAKQVSKDFEGTKVRLESLYEHWEEASELN